MGIEELKKQEAARNASSQNEKSWFKKWWGIGLIIFLSVNIIGVFLSPSGLGSSSSKGTGLSPCECSRRWLTTHKSYMKATDRWKHDECTRKYGGFAGANEACINPDADKSSI